MRLILNILLVTSLSHSMILTGQAEFKLVPVDQLETSQNTVTCTAYQSSKEHYIYLAGDGNKI